jgi:hypothetical protein
MIFVFGSNEAGIHGAGAAKYALEHEGAKYGVGIGLQGNSYAFPTKDMNIDTLPWISIVNYAEVFKDFAYRYEKSLFKVSRVGCGLAGLKDKDMAKLFVSSPRNCYFDKEWEPFLGPDYNYWGTYGG